MSQPWSAGVEIQAKAWTEYYSALTQRSSQYLSYAYRCYRNQTEVIPADCNLYTLPTLPYSVDTNAACPFNASICKMAQGNILFDSGYLDSYEHLGLNDGPRFGLRLKRQCAPLVTEGYMQTDNNTSNPTVQYSYGPSRSANKTRLFTHALPLQPKGDLHENEDLLFGEDYTITYVPSGRRIPAPCNAPSLRDKLQDSYK